MMLPFRISIEALATITKRNTRRLLPISTRQFNLTQRTLAYAEAGEFEEAVKREHEALELPDMKPKQDEGKARVLLYQSRTPFREERRDPPKPAPIISSELR